MTNFEPITTVCLIFVSLWIIRMYLNIIFDKNNISIVYKVISWFLLLIFEIAIEYGTGITPIILLILNIIAVFFICLINYQGNVRKKILYSVLLYIIWMAIEICLYQIFIIFHFPENEIAISGAIVSKILMIILVNLLNIFYNGKEKYSEISYKYLLMLLIVPLCSIFIAHNLFVLNRKTAEQTISSLISYALILLVNITIFEVYLRLVKYYELQKENTLFEQQLKLIEKHMCERESEMSDVREMKHNLKGHMIYLIETLDQNKYIEAAEYINELLNELESEKEQLANTGNTVIDTIINYKCAMGKKNGITFQTNLFVPMELPIKEKDLCIILSNALDNAIEAASVCEMEKKVEISIATRKSALSIVIKNSFSNEIVKDVMGNIKTTKKETSNHGLGLSSIKKAVNKYNGETVIETEGNIFCLMIFLDI